MSLLDIHTHHPAPQPQAVISVSPRDFSPVEGQLYSVGLHPWGGVPSPEDLTLLDEPAAHPQVVAIGECGIDPLKGAPMFRQLLTFRHHVELSEQLHKPLIIHEVKAHDVITGLRRDLAPVMPWAIHGFRGKPTVAEMLLKAGLWLSFGIRFNPEALAIVPYDRLLAETDEAPVEITKVIAALSQAAGIELTDNIAASTAAFLNIS
ncbi:MAG: TatD family hydrolase [Muribaculaceae bacterium]|nr:TatD family hydrolase [Muribaculaceae bacterium]